MSEDVLRQAIFQVTQAAATLDDRDQVKFLFLYVNRLLAAMLFEGISEDEELERIFSLAYADSFDLPADVKSEFACRVLKAIEATRLEPDESGTTNGEEDAS